MKTVQDLLKTKGTAVFSVAPATSVYDALALMAEKNVGALLVLDGEKLAGIFSERDYARKVILKGRTSRELAVSEIMTSGVISMQPGQTIAEVMKLMTQKHIRHLPVVDKEKVVGVISIGDVVKEIIADQQDTIHHLEDYIVGKR